MLRPIDENAVPPPLAYRVPWLVDRCDPAHPVITNDGSDPADFVRVFHDEPVVGERTQLWGQVLPGEHVELCLCGADLDEVVVSLAWFRHSDGLEYLWRFVV